jgi:glucose/arabinose dehydrogenase
MALSRIHILLLMILGFQESSLAQIEKLKLPDGFKISEFAQVSNARSLCQSPSGTIFVGTKQGNKIHALQDLNKDGVAEKKYVLADGLSNMPNGVAFKNGDLYIAEVNRILVLRNIETRLNDPPEPEIFYDGYPSETHHGWKNIAFGPDGWLYVPVGAPCNICFSENPVYATITRLSPDGKEMQIYASGVRNTVGITWHPETGDLWFTDNGRDMLGEDVPPDELNMAYKKNMHFGYPFCHGGFIADPEFGDQLPCSTFEAPRQKLGPHVASLGLKFCNSPQFPEEYQGDIFIAEHGSWNRKEPIGYRITRVKLEGNKAVEYSNFITGWLEKNGNVWGRPVDILFMDDGSMLISDDFGGKIYRVSYEE